MTRKILARIDRKRVSICEIREATRQFLRSWHCRPINKNGYIADVQSQRRLDKDPYRIIAVLHPLEPVLSDDRKNYGCVLYGALQFARFFQINGSGFVQISQGNETVSIVFNQTIKDAA